MSFADQLKSERKRLGLTQAGADALLDTCKGQVAAWEIGRNTPHVLTQEGSLGAPPQQEDAAQMILPQNSVISKPEE